MNDVRFWRGLSGIFLSAAIAAVIIAAVLGVMIRVQRADYQRSADRDSSIIAALSAKVNLEGGDAGQIIEQAAEGAQGPAGTPGAPGIPGPEGAAGPPGVPGPTGPQGVAGAIGPAGADGAQGPPGVPGAAGVDGQDGQDGTNGADGAPGPSGPAGPPPPVVGPWSYPCGTDLNPKTCTTTCTLGGDPPSYTCITEQA